MEATPGFEPGNQSFADSCLTTWLCRLIYILYVRIIILELNKINGAGNEN